MSKIDNFPYPTPIPAKMWGCFFWSRSAMLGSAESEMVRLISREIIFAELQPIWSRFTIQHACSITSSIAERLQLVDEWRLQHRITRQDWSQGLMRNWIIQLPSPRRRERHISLEPSIYDY